MKQYGSRISSLRVPLFPLVLAVWLLALSGPEDQKELPFIGAIQSQARQSPGGARIWAVSQSGLYLSRNNGRTWIPHSLPDAGANPESVWLAGRDSAVFACTSRHGMYRSRDDGKTWEQANAGLPHSIGAAPVSRVVAVASSAADPDRIYCATEVEGIFRSEDGGLSWIAASRGLPVPIFRRSDAPLLAVDPVDARRVYALLKVPVHSHLETHILYRSLDAGYSWMPLKRFSPGSVDGLRVPFPGQIRLSAGGKEVAILDTMEDGPVSISRYPILSPAPAPRRPAAADRDSEGIAIMHDDGTLVVTPFDLDGRSVSLTPAEDGGYTLRSGESGFDAELGEKLELGDDDACYRTLPFHFSFYGQKRSTIFIGSNGVLSFEGGVRSSGVSLDRFFNGEPMIAPFWLDLDPESGSGGVYLRSLPDRVVVTWSKVPRYYRDDENTFQAVFLPSGEIQFHYEEVEATAGLTGISNCANEGQLVSFSLAREPVALEPRPIYQLFSIAEIHPFAVAQRFYRSHEDDYDAIAVFSASEYPPNLAAGAVAYNLGVRNDIKGLGLSLYDSAAEFGSAGRLQSYLNINSLSFYPADPLERIGPYNHSTVSLLGEEWGHRFLAFAGFRDRTFVSSELLGRSYAHWSYFFDSRASVMEGNEWRDDGNGSFTTVDESRTYGPLDHYLMGLKPAQAVGPLMLLTDVQPLFSGIVLSFSSTFGRANNAIRDATIDFGQPDRIIGFRLALGSGSYFSAASTFPISESGRTEAGPDPTVISTPVDLKAYSEYLPTKSWSVRMVRDSVPRSRYFDPETGKFSGDNMTFKGVRRDLDVQSIIEAEGERIPAFDKAPKSFRQAFILLVPPGKEASEEDIRRVAGIRRAWEAFFSTASGGLASVSTSAVFGLGRVTEELAPGTGRIYTSAGAEQRIGYALLESGHPRASAAAVLVSKSAGRPVSETALAAGVPILRARWFVRKTATVDTGVAVASPLGAASITLEMKDASGKTVANASLGIPKGGQIARFASELFSAYRLGPEFHGSMTLTSSSPVSIVSLQTTVNAAGDFLVTAIPVGNLDTPQPQGPLYIPQIADGGGYVTEILLVNPAASTLSGRVEFHGPDGGPLDMRISGASRTFVPYRLAPHASSRLVTEGIGPAPRTGYVVVKADASQPNPMAGAIFSLSHSGDVVTATGILAASTVRGLEVPLDTTAGHDLGLAVVNPSGQPTALRLTAAGLDGRPVNTAGSVTVPANGQIARFLSQLLPRLPAGFRGSLALAADVPVGAVALRSLAAADRFLLCAVPGDLEGNRQASAQLYIPHIAHSPGFSTEIGVFNRGTEESKMRLTLFSQTGELLNIMTK